MAPFRGMMTNAVPEGRADDESVGIALASWRPAWRAARVEPMEALREE